MDKKTIISINKGGGQLGEKNQPLAAAWKGDPISRRRFLKRTGGFIGSTVIVLHGLKLNSNASESTPGSSVPPVQHILGLNKDDPENPITLNPILVVDLGEDASLAVCAWESREIGPSGYLVEIEHVEAVGTVLTVQFRATGPSNSPQQSKSILKISLNAKGWTFDVKVEKPHHIMFTPDPKTTTVQNVPSIRGLSLHPTNWFNWQPRSSLVRPKLPSTQGTGYYHAGWSIDIPIPVYNQFGELLSVGWNGSWVSEKILKIGSDDQEMQYVQIAFMNGDGTYTDPVSFGEDIPNQSFLVGQDRVKGERWLNNQNPGDGSAIPASQHPALFQEGKLTQETPGNIQLAIRVGGWDISPAFTRVSSKVSGTAGSNLGKFEVVDDAP
ncbi:MAG: hypothetical protein KA004_13060 [Verrucomicrobiales bacterium]|nr:hypothetical protein [Verrucomicrobiales bacterium]